MANKLWADWYDEVLPALTGLPTAMAAHRIKRAAIEFCDRSMAWRAAIPAFEASINVGAYVLPAPIAGTQIVRITELRFLTRELKHRTPAWLQEHYGTQDWRAVTGETPTYWTSELPNQVRIVGIPTVTTPAGLAGWAAIKPTDDATGIEEAIWREYHDVIGDLAKARAMQVPKKPYSDKDWARELLKDVDHRIGSIALHQARGGGAAMRTRTHWI